MRKAAFFAKMSALAGAFLSFRGIKRAMPRGLFGRTLLIIVMPTLLALSVATFVFFDRHWSTVTDRLTDAVAGDISLTLELMNTVDSEREKNDLLRLADRKLDLYVTYAPGEKLAKAKRSFRVNPLRDLLNRALRERLHYPFAIAMRRKPPVVAVQVEVPKGVYTFLVPQRRIYTPTTEVFIGWMIGSSILLSVIALLFMRNQVRPIRRLAEAAEVIGKGQDVPWFKAEGAAEVRQAAAALLVMRDRLKRQITQRTTMLAGVSHDLRTPLTRMKLQLAMMPSSPETEGMATDIADMQGMVEAYLAFAKGEEAEASVEVDLAAFLGELVETARRQHPDLAFDSLPDIHIEVRRHALRRCLMNLIGNALRYGTHASVSMAQRSRAVDIIVDDDGPGIAPENREDVFRPFLRLDESRNPVTGGVGLGLTIARDIARAHGGEIVLEESPKGGLRARLWLPV